jgi:exodeoxyribonuclease VII small subunit
MTNKTSLETMNFETALKELESLVKDMESGKITLEESVTAYERGMALKAHCEQKLQSAKMKIEKIMVGADNNLTAVPFDEK